MLTSGFSRRKRSRLSRASIFRVSATASSRSTMTTSAPVARALAMRSGRVAGTNRAERTMLLMDGILVVSHGALLAQRLDVALGVAQFTQQAFGMLAERRDRVHARF